MARGDRDNRAEEIKGIRADSRGQTPSLSDSLEQRSPPDSMTYPRTPSSMPRTPPMHFYDRT